MLLNPVCAPSPDYRVSLELLGEGSFGWVYRTLLARHARRAVKLFKADTVNTAMVHRELEKLQEVKGKPSRSGDRL